MEKLTPNCTYHIFNHANGFENIFVQDENYRFFLEKYRLYIRPVAETYAYCLLPNHFHLVVRIRKAEAIETNFSKVPNFGKVTDEFISKQFSKFFSCYTQSFNKVNNRRGSMFIKNFKRELIDHREYFEAAVVYTHRNPVHHGFCMRYEDWGYSSYNEAKANKSETIETEKLLKTFGGLDNFIQSHQLSLEKYRQQLVSDI
jgi:putative transposase